jgi:hypothetical protein
MPPSSALKMETTFSPKSWYVPTSPHGATTRNTSIDNFTAVRTSIHKLLSSRFISRGCVPGNRNLNRKDVNRKLLDTIIYLTSVTKFSFSFQIWHIYIYKETTYIELKQFITKSGHKKSRDLTRNDVYRKDL